MVREKPRRNSLDTSPIPALESHSPVSETPHSRNDLPRWASICLSIFAVIHVAAVYAEPFRFSTQAESPFPARNAVVLRDGLKPYIDIMYLNHGYYFFAPNPGPAHLVVCVFNDLDAVKQQELNEDAEAFSDRLVYPDKTKQKPRLLYHRYFMYTEFYNTLFMPLDLPENADDGAPLPPDMARGKQLYRILGDSLDHYFRSRYPDRRFQIYRVEHGLPTAEQVLDEGLKLTDRRFYAELPESYELFQRPVFDPMQRSTPLEEREAQTWRRLPPADVRLDAPINGAGSP